MPRRNLSHYRLLIRDVAVARLAVAKNLSKINFPISSASKFAAQNFPVGGATGVLYARRSADGISMGGRTESGVFQFTNLFADRS